MPAVRAHAQVLFKVNREDDLFAVRALQKRFRLMRLPSAQEREDTIQNDSVEVLER
jgi:hypothetical protein